MQKELTNINVNDRYTSSFIKPKEVPTCHSNNIIALLQLNNNLILSSSYDRQISVHDSSCSHQINKLKETKYGAKCLIQLADLRIVSGSYTSISIWNFPSLDHIKDIIAHSDWVICLIQLKNKSLCSSSSDLNIHIWEINTFEITQSIIGHNQVINTIIELDNERLVSGSSDNTLKIWALNKQNAELISTLRDKYCWFNCMILLQDGRIAAGAWDSTIKLYNMNTYKLEGEILEHEYIINSLIQLKSGLVISASNQKIIKVWNVMNKQCLSIIEENYSIGKMIELNNGGVLMSKNNKLTLWI